MYICLLSINSTTMALIENLRTILLDNQETSLFTGQARHAQWQNLSNKATICIGVRRCGKSTLLNQKIEEKKALGLAENILSLNFFDDRLTELRTGNLQLILDAYYAIYPHKKGEKIFCFFDELQECQNWEAFVDRILRSENAEVYITGSSAKLLATEIATQMRGRSLTFELFPFSFTEYLEFKNIAYKKLTSQAQYRIQHEFNAYFNCGGFPEVSNVDEKLRIKIHQEYYKTIVHRDIIERFDSLHPKATMQIAYRLLSSVSSLYSLNRITDYLKSLGYKVSKDFVSNCIGWLEDAFFLFSVKKYDKSVSKQNLNAKKIYCIDHALVTSVTNLLNEKQGYLLENMVFGHLRRKTENIYYYKTAQGNEVDFLWFDSNQKPNLVQVSWDVNDEQTRKREIRALVQAMDEAGLNTSVVVSNDHSEIIKYDGKEIHIIPAWKYFLS